MKLTAWQEQDEDEIFFRIVEGRERNSVEVVVCDRDGECKPRQSLLSIHQDGVFRFNHIDKNLGFELTLDGELPDIVLEKSADESADEKVKSDRKERKSRRKEDD